MAPVLLHNDLDNNFDIGEIQYMEIYNNNAYLSLPDEGKIVRVSLLEDNAPMVDVVTGLSLPTGLQIVGNELYFLQEANDALQFNTGKLCKIDVTQTSPAVTVLHSTLQFPQRLKMNGTTAYIIEAHPVLVNGNFQVEHMELSVVVGSTKTVLHNNFEYVDDIDYYNNKIYLINWNSNISLSNIQTVDVSTNTPNTPQVFWTDTTGFSPYNLTISGAKMYLNTDSVPAVIRQLDMLNPSATLVTVASPFGFNGNTAYVNDMVMAPGNILYAMGRSYVSSQNATNYLLYKADLSSLGSDQFELSKGIIAFPNPATDSFSIEGYEAEKDFAIYSLDGKEVMRGRYPGSINVATFSAGIYLVKLDNGGTVKLQKN
ncbi:MAG: T9SS type A sorting domain-containing protein [Pedobacter sp.]|nr:MAG: T9SS type A sorting domain-containing protein [Pedobacter sp.]